MAEQKTLTVGLIGCGDISRSHLKTYQALGLKCVAMCDLDTSRVESRKEQFSMDDADVMTDYEELVKRDDIDIVTVATPVAMHAPMTIAALRAGKHVACEKPSTLDINENRQIIEEADKARKNVIFFSSRMRTGAATLAKRYVDDGDVGDIYRVAVQYFRNRGRPGVDIIKDARWFANKKLAGGGIMMDMGQYFMDCVLNLTGWPTIESVAASTWKGFPHDLPDDVVYDVDEHATIFARAGACTFTFDYANISNHKPVRRIMILGTKGGILMDDDYFKYYAEKGPWQQMEHTTGWRDKTGGGDNAYAQLMKAVRGEPNDHGTTPRQALAITELTQMAYRSDAEKREVKRTEL